MPDYLKSLSAAQLAVVTHPAHGALAISAPPGSGKTRVLTSRVAWLVRHEKIMPEEMVVVTFTNKATNEMRHRLHQLIGAERTARLLLGTFHALCARYLRRYGGMIGLENNFSIMDVDDSRKVIKEILKPMKENLEAEGLKIKPEQAQGTISWSKAKGISVTEYRNNINRPSGKGYRSAKEEVSSYKAALATVYEQYEKTLRNVNALDFDDLIVMGEKLLSTHPSIVQSVRHVLVDEMQDTNTTQYQLMSHFASAKKCLTTVGDPDQAVYGWRAAEVGNFEKMKTDFQCEQALLEENYRSTSNVLRAALAVIEQDRHRVAKGLFTAHPCGPPAVLKKCLTTQHEASFVATEIKRIVAHSGGMLNYSDFAILLRYNALSREIEQALQSERIPSRMMGGSKFFDRMEIKDMLAYLTLVVNPTYTPAFIRAINVPKRGMGEKSVKDFLATAAAAKMTPMRLAEKVADELDTTAAGAKKRGKGSPSASLTQAVKPPIKRCVRQFVGAVRELRKAAEKGDSVSHLIEMIIDNVDYKSHLQKEQDFDSRMENVKELISFSTTVAQRADEMAALVTQSSDDESRASSSDFEEGAAIEFVPERNDLASTGSKTNEADDKAAVAQKIKAKVKRTIEAQEAPIEIYDSEPNKVEEELTYGDEDVKENHFDRGLPRKKARHTRQERSEEPDLSTALPAGLPLRTFLEECTLSADLQSNVDMEDSSNEPKVTISTCHAAKGLEYPVVFVMGTEDGIFPFYRCTKEHEIDEERRLLYVAMTRAQALLIMTHCSKRIVGGATDMRLLSQFIRPVVEPSIDGTWHKGLTKAGSNLPASKVAFETGRPKLEEPIIGAMASVLERAAPSADAIRKAVDEFQTTSTAIKINQSELSSFHPYNYSESDREFSAVTGRSLSTAYGRAFRGRNFEAGFRGGFGDGFRNSFGRSHRSGESAGDFASSPSRDTRRHYMTSRTLSDGIRSKPGDFRAEHLTRGFSTASNGAPTSALGVPNNCSAQHGDLSKPFTDPRLKLTRSKSQSGPPVQAYSPKPTVVSSLWIEDYKKTGNTAISSPATQVVGSETVGQDQLMASFQSSRQASIAGLKDLLDRGQDGGQDSAGTQSVGASASNVCLAGRSASTSTLGARPPSVGFASSAGRARRTKSLGIRRLMPASASTTKKSR